MEAKARDLYRELTGSTDLEQAKTYRLTLEERDRIRSLAREQALLTADIKSHVHLIEKLERQILDTERKFEASARNAGPVPGSEHG